MSPIGSIFGNAAASCAAQAAISNAQASIGGGTYPNGMGGASNQASYPGFSGWSGTPIATPAQRDPLEYATETALKQPADKRWRRFQHALFLAEDVIGVHAEGSGSICVRLHHSNSGSTMSDYNYVFTLPFDCADPVQWFAEHVLNMDFPNAKHAT